MTTLTCEYIEHETRNKGAQEDRGVEWHTGKVVACSAVGLRFKPWQGRGIL